MRANDGDYYVESVGPAHPQWMDNQGDFTQIQVFHGTYMLAQFVGPYAKILSGEFINHMKNGRQDNE